MHAYVWDRYYGMCLAKYPHTDVVNSVAFNPRDTEMLVTTSDDYSIKVTEERRLLHINFFSPPNNVPLGKMFHFWTNGGMFDFYSTHSDLALGAALS